MDTSGISHHIHSRYNADLEGVRSGVLQMGGMVEQQVQNGVKAVVTGDSRLGEEVAAAVVLNEGATADERELKEHAAKQLADFKMPKTIVILQDIPKGATGKVQRIGLAEKLGLVKAKV